MDPNAIAAFSYSIMASNVRLASRSRTNPRNISNGPTFASWWLGVFARVRRARPRLAMRHWLCQVSFYWSDYQLNYHQSPPLWFQLLAVIEQSIASKPFGTRPCTIPSCWTSPVARYGWRCRPIWKFKIAPHPCAFRAMSALKYSRGTLALATAAGSLGLFFSAYFLFRSQLLYCDPNWK